MGVLHACMGLHGGVQAVCAWACVRAAVSRTMRPPKTKHHTTSQTNHHSINTQVILEEPVERWPRVDALLSWHSDGFPLRKAQAYAALRRPFLVNDVGMQDVLLDRRRVYRLLQVRMCV